MSAEELRTISVLESFPRKLPTRKLLAIYVSSRLEDEFYGKLLFMASFCCAFLTLLSFVLYRKDHGFKHSSREEFLQAAEDE